MCSSAIVISQARKQNVGQMPLAQDHNVIKAFASDGADQPFAMSILPGRSRRGRPVADPHGAKTPCEYLAIDAVAITNEIVRRPFPTASLGELSGDPFGGRMRRHSEP